MKTERTPKILIFSVHGIHRAKNGYKNILSVIRMLTFLCNLSTYHKFDKFQTFLIFFTVTKVRKLQKFPEVSYVERFITNVYLKLGWIKNTELFYFCNRERETYLYLFTGCSKFKEKWLKIPTQFIQGLYDE